MFFCWYVTFMSFCNLLAHAQPQSGSFTDFFGRKKWLKYALGNYLWNTWPIVLHFQSQPVFTHKSSDYYHTSRTAFEDRITAVLNQIQDYLLLELPLFDGQWLSHPPAFKFGGAEIA